MGAPEHVGKLLNTPPNGCTFPVFGFLSSGFSYWCLSSILKGGLEWQVVSPFLPATLPSKERRCKQENF